MAADRQHAHHLLDQLGPGQLDAVVHLLETMVSHEEDSDTLSSAERKAVAEADEWLKHNQPIPERTSSGGVRLDHGNRAAKRLKVGYERSLGETSRARTHRTAAGFADCHRGPLPGVYAARSRRPRRGHGPTRR